MVKNTITYYYCPVSIPFSRQKLHGVFNHFIDKKRTDHTRPRPHHKLDLPVGICLFKILFVLAFLKSPERFKVCSNWKTSSTWNKTFKWKYLLQLKKIRFDRLKILWKFVHALLVNLFTLFWQVFFKNFRFSPRKRGRVAKEGITVLGLSKT